MSEAETNSKLIGAFVLGGILLLVGAVVLFSDSNLFTPKRRFVAYFQQSVTGLSVGAPIKFRGIPVGEVLAIEGIYNPETGIMIPRLILEFRPETMRNAYVKEGEYTLLPMLMKAGLRASLKSQSMLTGQLYVSLDFHPDTTARTMGEGDDYPEMPTIDSGLEEVMTSLANLPVDELLERAIGALSAVEEVLENPDIPDVLAALPGLATEADRTLADLRTFMNGELVALTGSATDTFKTATDAIDSLPASLSADTLLHLNATLAELELTLHTVRQGFGENSQLVYEVLSALREITTAARSFRELADELEENPESLIRGKSK